MPEFISRPNFGPASELWSKAIQLAANKSNPMIEGVNAGLEQFRQGLGSMAQMGAQQDAQSATAERAKQELYSAHVADMMAKGILAPIENRLSPAMAPGQGVMAPGPAPTYAGLPSVPMAGAAMPDFAATMPEASKVLPPGSVGTTHDFARALGITPSGPEMAILKPKEKAQTVALTPEMIANYPSLAKMGYAPGHEMPLSVFQQQTKPVVSGSGMPKAPTGFRFTQGGDLEAIPGGPADMKIQDAKTKIADAAASAQTHAKNVIEAADSAIKAITWKTTGVIGAGASNIPGSNRKALEGYIDTLKSNLAFERLQEMRNESKTGGALGQVSDNELRLLSSVVSSLNPDQAPDVLKANIEKVKTTYGGIISKLQSKTQGQPNAVGDIALTGDKAARLAALRAKQAKR